MSLDFPAFTLTEEHQELRAAVRALADDKIAPRAAEVDESGEFSSACKCFASDVAMEVTTDAVQLLGGYGYVKDYRWSG